MNPFENELKEKELATGEVPTQRQSDQQPGQRPANHDGAAAGSLISPELVIDIDNGEAPASGALRAIQRHGQS